MRGCLITLVALLFGVVALVVGNSYYYPNYTYRYRLTVNIEVDGKLHSGSSVIEVTWRGGPKIGEGAGYWPTVRGQAALIDLADRGLVVATLIAEDNTKAGFGAQWIVPRAFGDENGGDYKRVPELREKRELSFDNLPRFLWFPNPQDPNTAETLTVDNIPSVFGPSARFAGAFVEITSDPLVIDVRQKLPWIKALEERARGEQVLYLPNKLGISRYMFIADTTSVGPMQYVFESILIGGWYAVTLLAKFHVFIIFFGCLLAVGLFAAKISKGRSEN